MRKKITSYIYQTGSLLRFYMSNILAALTHFNSKKSRADFKEDLLIEQLSQGRNFSYVDIGAGHPIIGSNTFYFYKKGFKGLTIEPIRFHHLLHRIIRYRDHAINGLVADDISLKKFYEFNPTQYSTTSESQFKYLLTKGMKPRKIYYVSGININDLLRKHQLENYFISIDCEGYDYEILKSLDYRFYRKPFAIVLENQVNKNIMSNIDILMAGNGFELRYKTNNNLIYSNLKNLW